MRAFWAFIILICMATSATAHEVRPAFLKATEMASGQFEVIWKQPIIDGKRLKITPQYPPACEMGTITPELSGGTVRERYILTCPLTEGRIQFDGLARTLTDIFVEINYLSNETRTALIKPSHPALDLSRVSPPSFGPYLWIGIEHIIFGWDHLLFVICLTLMVTRRQVLGVATSFTLAHSLTLAAAALGLIDIPIRPVEILIAASIVLMAVEILRKFNGQSSLSLRRPYLIGFLIGLIHGCGFASALSGIGLPKDTELWALLLFNLGVELGQFAVIGVFIAALFILSKLARPLTRPVEISITYVSATIAMYWVIARSSTYLTGFV